MWARSVRWLIWPHSYGHRARTIHPVATASVTAPSLVTTTADLTLLYDGGCPLCLREVRFLKARDASARLAFVDVDDASYEPSAWAGISYRQAMARIHAIKADGTVLKDVAVFREAYQLVGLGWMYAPTTWPLLGPLVDRLYTLWAKWRLAITGRDDLEALCACRR